ncbi:arginine/serine-rich protein 1-like isoform X1 [Ceratitis capitata]|uniref:arginine/serine-rich protein 1-like isoform X1 n=1 Tax=Ceratitis capitata TaxID=7213 RepID=UPI0003296D5F|nr:arginine/serine-rich protein 1-like isoform X1 [Ceratitis capitata]XP_020715512.1 arginine/serine-rich protein 1-like isoform X1 [Ceratitis capitata]XP_020715513.1 arginine/serine-rich protein 1-like isoform X1 [Ceratitis capitata]XP_020715514.1 arginine/serine-rich protein 1-like isoform X1 [Ceratitis capitata]
MSSMNQRHKRDTGYDLDTRREERRKRSRSSSRSRHRRYRDSRSRSRSRSIDHRRRHNDKRSRSRSRSFSRRDRHNSSRRHRDSRSRSRSRTRSYRTSKRDSRSHSTDRLTRNIRVDDDRRAQDNVIKNLPINSTESNRSSSTYLPNENTDLQHLPLPNREPIGAYYNLDIDEPFDKERIHREMEEKLRQALAKEGKVYPPKKPEATHPVFANDGSFLELFKKMQAQQQQHQQHAPIAAMPAIIAPVVAAPPLASTSTAATYIAATSAGKSAPPPPIVGRRRGGKILKTGVVAKPKAQAEQSEDPKDFWSLYLAEVNKYKNHACESDTGNRPLVK